MERRIFEIGRGRYKFDKKTLGAFIEESRNRSPEGERPNPGDVPAAADRVDEPGDQELQRVIEEVTALYHDYLRGESVDLLIKLKCRLEEVSTRYQSHVLAAEVLNINSCLPYERRVPALENRYARNSRLLATEEIWQRML